MSIKTRNVKELSLAFPEHTAEAIERFSNINNKEELTFLQFDICDFYAPTTEDLLMPVLLC